ncbi:hypothetical protein MMC21_005314 [Puttea exsequens]|nr:hypothetical protein [Puttea exsequens]
MSSKAPHLVRARPHSANSPDPARVRDNQRRSRARRKEYLQELEAKLRKNESLGVQASIDIQSAAKAVLAENARLKKENDQLKDENERMRVLVKNGEGGYQGQVYGSTTVKQSKDFRPCGKPEHSSHDAMVTAKARDSFAASLAPAQEEAPKNSNKLELNQDTTTCEYAAHIITSMRADVSTEDVRAHLGCGSGGKCKIDNAKLFLAVDRYTE